MNWPSGGLGESVDPSNTVMRCVSV